MKAYLPWSVYAVRKPCVAGVEAKPNFTAPTGMVSALEHKPLGTAMRLLSLFRQH